MNASAPLLPAGMPEAVEACARLAGPSGDRLPSSTAIRESAGLGLTPRLVETTVLFADLRGFSRLATRFSPLATFDLLNEFLALIVGCLDRANCRFSRVIADAVLAGFGPPIPAADDADRALRAAIAMQQTLAAWNARSGSDRPAFHAGIGVNSDRVVVGRIGTKENSATTLIGDGVNVAARLERACKHYGTDILISEATRRRLIGSYAIRPVDRVLLDGQPQPIDIFEVLDHRSPTVPFGEIVGRTEDAVAAYRIGRLDCAARGFAGLLSIDPCDGLARHYLARCRTVHDETPPAEGKPISEWPDNGRDGAVVRCGGRG